MRRSYFSSSIQDFLTYSNDHVLGILTQNNEFSLELTQRSAWENEIDILKSVLNDYKGRILFEYSIPRMGKRIDVILLIDHVIFILEFKIGEKEFLLSAIDQVWDYALDLKNFHETSHNQVIAPVVIATNAKGVIPIIATTLHSDDVLIPIRSNVVTLRAVIEDVLQFIDGENIEQDKWESGKYSPTPTIVEAAMALYSNHSVADISRTDASAVNLSETSAAISKIIEDAYHNNEKSICFVTGVPGAGKTLVGLDIASKHLNDESKTRSVFLSGNGPLVSILREALTRDSVNREKLKGNKIKKGEALSKVKVFIQNVHHFRDECLNAPTQPPFEHVAIFDEAQRAWNHTQTANFMLRKKSVSNFLYSEPEFLISCLDRHKDWAVIVCLVGGGQEINTGEAGIGEWLESLKRSFPGWKVYISSRLNDSEYAAGNALKLLGENAKTITNDKLHLSVSMRSFRAEKVSLLVKNIIDLQIGEGQLNFSYIREKYPITLTRNIGKAKKWLKEKARGNERYGIIVSSQAQRLKPHAIDVKSPMDPVHWFLDGKEDVRSCYYLEDVATEFHVQGLELDWTCITWDADLRYSPQGWETFQFVGHKWQNIHKTERKQYLKNAYRVLLTRARQGMVIVVPEGEVDDPTRKLEYYDLTYNYLKEMGFEILP
jgi:DUF2075 family protein